MFWVVENHTDYVCCLNSCMKNYEFISKVISNLHNKEFFDYNLKI